MTNAAFCLQLSIPERLQTATLSRIGPLVRATATFSIVFYPMYLLAIRPLIRLIVMNYADNWAR